MKKILILLLALFSFTACSKNNSFYLDEEYYNKSELIEIDSKGIKELEKEKKSFIVFVNLKDCISCIEFKKVLNQFMENTKLTIYSLSVSDIEGTCIDDCVKYSPSVVIYRDGEVVDYLDALKDSDLPYYESVDGFKSWLTKYVILK